MNPLRCSTLAREVGLDPLGTAGSYAGFLLVEWPLPVEATRGYNYAEVTAGGVVGASAMARRSGLE